MGRSLDLVHVIYADTLPMDGGWIISRILKGANTIPLRVCIAGKRHTGTCMFLDCLSAKSANEPTPGHDFCCNVLHSSLLLSQFSSRGDILPRRSFIAWQQNENERDNTLLRVLSRPGIGSACARSVDVSYCIYAM